jgi:DNA polymerase III subunit beta
MTVATEFTFEVGEVVKILRLKDPQDTRFVGQELEITGLTPKGWVKINLPDGSGSVTLKPDWVEKVPQTPDTTQPQATVETEESENHQTDQMQETTPEATGVVSSVEEIVDTGASQDSTEPNGTELSQNISSGLFKFSCNSTIFAKAVAQVKRVIRTMLVHPVLNHIKIEVNAETRKVTLTGFDLSLGVITFFGAEKVELGGEYTIDATLLHNIVSQLPESTITLERTDADNQQVKLTTPNGVYFIAGMGAYEYPELPLPRPGDHLKIWRINAKVLRVGIESTAYAAASDLSKMVLCGLHLTATSENKLEIAATDGHRLALYRSTLASTREVEQTQHLTIPTRSIWEVHRYLTDDEAIAQMTYEVDMGSVSIVQFRCGDTTIVTRLLEGQYPEYDNLIPKKFKREVWIERLLLIGTISRLAVTTDKNNIVRLDVDPDKKLVTLSAQNAETGSGQEALKAEISGEEISIAFNIKYIQDALKTLGTQEVAISINEKATPVICTPLNGYDIVTLIMPIQLRDK